MAQTHCVMPTVEDCATLAYQPHVAATSPPVGLDVSGRALRPPVAVAFPGPAAQPCRVGHVPGAPN